MLDLFGAQTEKSQNYTFYIKFALVSKTAFSKNIAEVRARKAAWRTKK